MLNEHETTLENIIHLFNHQNFTIKSHPSTRFIEENMSTLGIDDPVPMNKLEKKSDDRPSGGIGARIMRQLRRNTFSIGEKSSTATKKKSATSKSIEKLYTNKSLGRLKHSQLETIFEHEDEADANISENIDLDDTTKIFGKRKIKRSVTHTANMKTSKTLKQKRKKRIQKIFGVHKKIKSMSMKKFLERLNANDNVNLTGAEHTAGA